MKMSLIVSIFIADVSQNQKSIYEGENLHPLGGSEIKTQLTPPGSFRIRKEGGEFGSNANFLFIFQGARTKSLY